MRRQQALQILKQHEADLRSRGVRELFLFGSVARDQARPGSDVDVLVEFGRPVGLLAFVELQQFLTSILGNRVDLVTPDALRPDFREQVRAEALRAA